MGAEEKGYSLGLLPPQAHILGARGPSGRHLVHGDRGFMMDICVPHGIVSHPELCALFLFLSACPSCPFYFLTG